MESRRVKFIWARGTGGRHSAMDLVNGLPFSLKISGIQAVSVRRLTLNNHSSHSRSIWKIQISRSWTFKKSTVDRFSNRRQVFLETINFVTPTCDWFCVCARIEPLARWLLRADVLKSYFHSITKIKLWNRALSSQDTITEIRSIDLGKSNCST
jgi:hypothetical protein